MNLLVHVERIPQFQGYFPYLISCQVAAKQWQFSVCAINKFELRVHLADVKGSQRCRLKKKVGVLLFFCV